MTVGKLHVNHPIKYPVHWNAFLHFAIWFSFCITEISAQKVVVSENINIRTNVAYDIFPNIGGNILFYHDRGADHFMDVYDENLKFKQSRQLEFPYRTSNVINMVPLPDGLRVFIQGREDQKNYISYLDLDARGEPKDTVINFFSKESLGLPGLRSKISENKQKVLFFWTDHKAFHYILVSNESDTCRMALSGKIESPEFNFKSDFLGIELNNSGEIMILGSKERSWTRSTSENLMVMSVRENYYEMRYLTSKELEITQIEFAYDNVNNHLCIGGLLSRGGDDATVGYFVQRFSGKEEDPVIHIQPILYSVEFINELYGKKSNKIKKISDLYLDRLILRKDGGAILIMEIRKEFLRRAGANGMSRFGVMYSGRGFIDYYNEDVIMVSNHADGTEHWKNVLYKKQFSQDDNSMYSSFGVFLTPGRLKILYNDEIKTSSTVSEYVVDPMGNFERNSVLSTQYQNLKLRFKDAVQISPTSLLVPSEQVNTLNLVKIEFLQ